MSKKLAAKASLIQMPPPLASGGGVAVGVTGAAPGSLTGLPAGSPVGSALGASVHAAAATGDLPEYRAKTAPGSMAHFMASQSSAVREAEELRERLKSFDGAKPVRQLDPLTVRPSRWANRHEASFTDAAFAELKADIAAAGGNVQPVSVRPVLNGSTPGGSAAYELVFGHRRHRACLELGLPLQAMVADLSDRELFEAMERENRARKNLSAWEQGAMYKRALDEGLYPSQRKLSEALGVDVSLVSKSLSLARLPDVVVAAFASPLDIQFRWAQPLAEALQKDPEALIARARQARQPGMSLSAADVLDHLLGLREPAVLNRSTPSQRVIEGRAGRRAVMTRDAQGRVVIRFALGALSDAAEAQIAEAISRVMQKDG
jgi:ParB family chromosome partitioning protein